MQDLKTLDNLINGHIKKPAHHILAAPQNVLETSLFRIRQKEIVNAQSN